MEVAVTPIELHPADGYPIAATRFDAIGERRGNPTAVAQPFYRRFAEHAARRGFTTRTFDYLAGGVFSMDAAEGPAR